MVDFDLVFAGYYVRYWGFCRMIAFFCFDRDFPDFGFCAGFNFLKFSVGDGVLEFFAAWVPYADGDSYPAARQRVTQLLAGRVVLASS